MKRVKVRVPATTANLGPGFDCLGLALKLYNEVELKISAKGGFASGEKNEKLKIGERLVEIEGEGKDVLPKDERNIVYQAVKIVFDTLHFTPFTLHFRLVNRIPLARGLGSSAAARIGGLVAANKLCEVITSGDKLSDNEILNIATQLEGHPDNVVPAFFGGLCVSVVDNERVNYVKLGFPHDLDVVLCVPGLAISTQQARKILPKKILLGDAVFSCSRVAFLQSALNQKRYDLLKLAMEDKLHQPYRKRLIPGFDNILREAYRAGALGVALSGSGSSIVAISNKRLVISKKIGQVMVEAFKKENIESRYLILGIDREGTKIV